MVVILIMANAIWAPEGLSSPHWAKDRLAKKSAQIWIYAASSDNPDTCGTNKKLFLGILDVDVDNPNVVTPSPEEVCVLQAGGLHPRQAIKTPDLEGYCVKGVVVWTPPWCMFCDGKDNGDGWYLKILTDQWWNSQLTDTTTSYCGVVEFDDYSKFPYTESWTKKPWLSWNDREKLRGVIITDWPASLKLTVTGRQVRIEPLHACYAPTGKCIKDRLLWESESCPRFTTSAGKGSSCKDTARRVPVPVEGQDTEDSEHRAVLCRWVL